MITAILSPYLPVWVTRLAALSICWSAALPHLPRWATEGSRGALETVLTAPFGKILLAVIALGLIGYAIWRTIQAVKDADHPGNDTKGLAIRADLMVSAV